VDVIDALVDQTDAVVAALRHPDVEVVQRQPFAPADQQHLPEKVLRHSGHHGGADKEQEDDELALQSAPVARLHSVEEAPVPLVDQNGEVDDRQLGADHADEKPARAPAVLGPEIGQRDPQERAHGRSEGVHEVYSGVGGDHNRCAPTIDEDTRSRKRRSALQKP
jgi:hypothetical protein